MSLGNPSVKELDIINNMIYNGEITTSKQLKLKCDLQKLSYKYFKYFENRLKEFIKMNENLNEPILDDSYPIYFGFAYIIDNEVQISPISGTVRDLKKHFNCEEVRRCNLVGRGLIK